jgi:hypothetical protein
MDGVSGLRRKPGVELEAGAGEEAMETCRWNVHNSSKKLFM